MKIYCDSTIRQTRPTILASTDPVAPFIGAALSFLLLGEPLTPLFLVATVVMAAGCWLAAKSDR